MTLEQVLADARGDAAVLRRHGQAAVAEALERLADAVSVAAEDWLVFLSETDAHLRSGLSEKWLRARFAQWEREGHARMKGGEHQYRACIVPRRARIGAAAERGRQAAAELRKAS